MKLNIIPIPYQCRLCETVRKVYIRPKEVDGEYLIDATSTHRITKAACYECGTDRTHVIYPDDLEIA